MHPPSYFLKIWNFPTWNGAFVVSPLRGILPIRVIHENEDVYFEITELDPEQKGQVVVSRYLYDYPYKKVGSTTLQKDVGLH